jgi:hypothetical protein
VWCIATPHLRISPTGPGQIQSFLVPRFFRVLFLASVGITAILFSLIASVNLSTTDIFPYEWIREFNIRPYREIAGNAQK